MSAYEVVIGLEVHAQMLTASKIFCGCSTRFGAEANTQVCPVCAAFPGVLPVLNRQAVEFAVRTGLAIEGEVRTVSEYSRKNYFYPDLPAGYQITQYELPIVLGGHLEIEDEQGRRRRIGITRIHMEVDAGKSLHEGIPGASWVDLNRTGVPLMEIVSEPDLRSAEEAGLYLKKLRALLRCLGVCDGNMEQGSLRCDANVSIRPKGATTFGTRCEIKNLNSIRNVQRAIAWEMERHIEIVEDGGSIVQETRLWDANKGETRSMRSKEEAHDYRYFPEPDLPPLLLTEERIAKIRAALPELPEQRRARFEADYGLSGYDAGVLTAAMELADYFETALGVLREAGFQDPKGVANWVMGDLLGYLNRSGLEIGDSPVSSTQLARLLIMVLEGTISGKMAKQVFGQMCASGGEPEAIVAEQGLAQVSDQGAIAAAIDAVLAANPAQVAQYRAGKTQVMGFLVGQVMKATKGQANPGLLNTLLTEKLKG
ncbi:MAG: Asp-tRNA(Asn)/Glu-tRNA(Gln) amidotransferase subunit GatB [Magnetococcales bacterium]|nr:Asp-tRNA(Asn)/Glu-tRNA(Gln) amidotransferase subunit GatB [Magnetococcales bacterium]